MTTQLPRQPFGTAHPAAPRELAAALAPHLQTHRADHLVRLRYYDTFDWRLYARGRVLVQDVNDLTLLDLADGAVVARSEGLGALPSRFVRDWPDGPLREFLAPVVGVRAVLHLVTCEGPARSDHYTDPKTGRRWLLERRELHQVKGGGTRPFLHVVVPTPCDGRSTGGHRLARLLRRHGYRPVDHTLFVPAMARAGLEPGGYRKGFTHVVDRRERAGEAFAGIAAHLVARLRANRRGLEQDIDPEFLHDFRVATRRLRTLVAVAKGVLPRELRREAAARLKELGRASNRLRDLDVFLQQRADLLELLPADRRDEAELVFARAADARTACRREFEARLADPDFLGVIDWAAAHLAVAPDDAPKRARRRVGREADRLVRDTFTRLRDRGRGLDARSSDADLHRLRIAAKRHRYVVEFFAELYPAADVAEHLERLRALQDVLGAHNDDAQQRAELARLAPDDGVAHELARCIGIRQDEQRARFTAAWRPLAKKKTRKALERLVAAR